jgi:hypothetical protein
MQNRPPAGPDTGPVKTSTPPDTVPDRIALDTDFGKWHPAGPDTDSTFGESAPDRTDRIRWHPGTGPDTVPDRITHLGPGRKSTPDRTGRTGYDTREKVFAIVDAD